MPIKPALQMAVFEKQILLAEAMGKPLIIHCVKAFNELVELKRKFRPNSMAIYRFEIVCACTPCEASTISNADKCEGGVSAERQLSDSRFPL